MTYGYLPFSEGERHSALARLAGSWFRDGLSSSEVLEKALEWNLGNRPPLPENEVASTVSNISRRHEESTDARAARDGKRDEPTTIRDLLSQSGVEALVEGTSTEQLEESLRRLGCMARESNDLRRAVLREELVKRLKEIKVASPAVLADVALGTNRKPEATGEAKALFPLVEPWSEQVSGVMLADELTGLFRRFLILPKWAAETLALWVFHTWTFEAVWVTPYLGISSVLPRCRQKKPILASQLARLLRPFGVRPKLLRLPTDQPNSQNPERGYFRADFEDRFKRYIPLLPDSLLSEPLHCYNPRQTSDSADLQLITDSQDVTDQKTLKLA